MNAIATIVQKKGVNNAVKAYIAAQIATAIAGKGDLKGDYNAASNTPDLDSSPSGVEKGDIYYVSAAGNFFSAEVEVGDTLVARNDDAATEAEWIILQNNLTPESIKTQYESNSDTNALTDALLDKLNNIEALADVTDATNVLAALVGQAISAATATTTGSIQSTKGGSGTGAGISVNSGNPAYHLGETDAGVDEKNSDLTSISGEIRFRLVNDASNSAVTAWSLARSGTTVGTFTHFGDVDLNDNDLNNGGVGNFAGTGAGASVVLSGSTANEGGQVDFEPGSGGSKTLAIDSYNNTTYDALRIFNKTDGLVLLEIEQSGVIRVNTSYLDLNDNDIENVDELDVHGDATIGAAKATAKLTVGNGSYTGPHEVDVIAAGTNIDNGYSIAGSLRLYVNTIATNKTLIASNGANAVGIETNSTERITVESGGDTDFNDNDIKGIGQVTAKSYVTKVVNIADDTATTITIPQPATGLFILSVDSSTVSNQIQYQGYYWNGSSNAGFRNDVFTSGNITTSTSVLTGTTGADTYVTISVPASSSTLYVENRLGSTLTFRLTVIS